MIKRLSVAQRLSGLVAILTLAVGAVGWMGHVSGSATLARFATTYNDRVVPLEQLKTVADLYAVNIVDTAHKVRDGSLTWAQGQQNLDAAVAGIGKNWKAYAETFLTPEEKQLVVQTERDFGPANAAVTELRGILQQQDVDKLRDFAAKRLYPGIDPVSEDIGKLTALQLRVAAEEFASARHIHTRQNLFDLVVIALAVIVGIGLGLVITRGLIQALGGEPEDAAAVAAAIAAGDLRRPITLRAGDTTSLLASMASMQTSLRTLIEQISHNAHDLSLASNELSGAAARVSGSSEKQSESTSRIASAVEQMAVSIQTLSDQSQLVRGRTGKSREQALSAVEAICETEHDVQRIAATITESSTTMSRLTEQSAQIANVLAVIREVAEQTNLLALNAAIEAARAGEQGRGFAVVADEVRKLAERTSVSTVEISKVVSAIQSAGVQAHARVEEANGLAASGSGRALQAGEQIRSIGQLAEGLDQAALEMSGALGEQQRASQEIAAKLEQVSRMTEENHDAAASVLALAQRLSERAVQLERSTARFSC